MEAGKEIRGWGTTKDIMYINKITKKLVSTW